MHGCWCPSGTNNHACTMQAIVLVNGDWSVKDLEQVILLHWLIHPSIQFRVVEGLEIIYY